MSKIDWSITEFGIRLRPVRETDAAFIIALRTNPALARFVGDTDPNIENQKRWISLQRDRPLDFYLMAESILSGAPIGTISLYNFEQDFSAEWGRWILSPGVLAAPATAYLINKFAFEDLGLNRTVCKTVSSNLSVLSFHDRCGATRIGSSLSSTQVGGVPVGLTHHELKKQSWPTTKAELAKYALKVERFV